MSPRTRILFAVVALCAASVVAFLAFREETEAAAPIEAPTPAAPAVESTPVPPPAPPAEPSHAIPYAELTKTSAMRNEVIFTTSAMGEPMEVHPDGTVVIHNHRKVFTFADGRQEVRFARVTAKPTWIPLSGLQVPPEDQAPTSR